jgi:prefoldin subunit 5
LLSGKQIKEVPEMSVQEELNKLSEKIKQYRDEARVQLHLAREDVKDEWDDLEQGLDRFRNKMDQVLHDAENASQEARQTAQKLGEDLKSGYQNIRKKLK